MHQDFIKLFDEKLTPREQKIIIELIMLLISKNDEIDGLTKYIKNKMIKEK